MTFTARRNSLLIGLAAAFAFSTGCSATKTYSVRGLSPAEGADGTIVVERLDSGNHRVAVSFEHLTPPKRYGEKLGSYAIWLTPHDAETRLIGILGYDGEERAGRFETVTPFQRFEILVTAERTDIPETPSLITIAERRITGASS